LTCNLKYSTCRIFLIPMSNNPSLKCTPFYVNTFVCRDSSWVAKPIERPIYEFPFGMHNFDIQRNLTCNWKYAICRIFVCSHIKQPSLKCISFCAKTFIFHYLSWVSNYIEVISMSLHWACMVMTFWTFNSNMQPKILNMNIFRLFSYWITLTKMHVILCPNLHLSWFQLQCKSIWNNYQWIFIGMYNFDFWTPNFDTQHQICNIHIFGMFSY